MASRLSIPHPGRRRMALWHCNALHLSMFSDVFGMFSTFLVCSGLPCVHGFWTTPWLGHWGTSGDLVENEGLRGRILAFVTFASGRERLAVSTRSMPPICRPMSVWPRSWRHRSVPSIPGVIMVVMMWNIMKHFRCPVEFVDCIAVARLLLRSSKFGCFCPTAWPLGKVKISCYVLRLSSFAMFVCLSFQTWLSKKVELGRKVHKCSHEVPGNGTWDPFFFWVKIRFQRESLKLSFFSDTHVTNSHHFNVLHIVQWQSTSDRWPWVAVWSTTSPLAVPEIPCGSTPWTLIPEGGPWPNINFHKYA